MADLDPKLLERARLYAEHCVFEMGEEEPPLLDGDSIAKRFEDAMIKFAYTVAQAVRDAERERCAKVAEDWSQSVANQPYKAWAWAIAAAIREGKE